MGKATPLIFRPTHGRGLYSALPPDDTGEQWNSFTEFKNVYIRDGYWRARNDDFHSMPGTFGPVRSIQYYNKIIDTSGTAQSKAVLVAGNASLLDENLFVIQAVLDPFELFYANVKNRLFYAGANNAPKVYDGTTAAPWGAAGPSSTLNYISFSTTNGNAKVAVGSATFTNASATVLWTAGTTFTTGATWVGKTIVFGGVEYTIQSVTDATHLVLSANFTGATLTGPFQVQYGGRSWRNLGPKYAYAYYNPTTGHITNGSPVLNLSEQQKSNVTVYLTGFAVNATLYAAGYTRIVLFASPSGGSDLLPMKLPVAQGDGLGFLINLGGPIIVTDDRTDDSSLGEILGKKSMPFENDPPPNMRYIAYWRGRFWGVPEAFPWQVVFSGDSGQIALGVPEECFPANNRRDVPSADNYATGLHVVGDDLIVATQRYAYFVSGSNEGDFELRRLSTRGFGIAQRGIDEHPGDSSEASSSAIYVGRDKRVWRHMSGGNIVDIGAPIQDKLDNVRQLADNPPFIVRVLRADRFWLLCLGISNTFVGGGYTGYDFFFYDFDQQVWMDWGYYGADVDHIVTALDGFIASGISFIALYTRAGFTPFGFNLLLEQGATLTGFLRTQKIYGTDRGSKKTMQRVRLETSDSTDPAWKVVVRFDDDPTEYEMTRAPFTQGSPRDAGSRIIDFEYQSARQFHCFDLGITIPSNSKKLYSFAPYLAPASTGTAES
jgi:hypothetical protein